MASDYANTVGSDYANTAKYNLSTDFNVTPYYDDYDDKKEYYRILYKPGFAVQGRELTQMQTILQKQIARFGRHVFEEGTIVIPGNFQLFANNISSKGALDYVKIKDSDPAGNPFTLSNFISTTVRGLTSNVTAHINLVADGTELNANTTKTLYVDYLQTSTSNSAQKTFISGETLVSNVGNLVVMTTNSIGKGSVFRISEGVIFSKEHFVYFPQQEVILDRYSDNPTAKVGFNVIENIVNYSTDSSLLDPALESSNYSAPGADRLKLTAVLEARPYDDTEGVPNFTTLFTIKDGVIQSYNQRTQYSILKDEMAKRTFDESGDYYVSGLDVELRENVDTGTNGGILSPSEGGDANALSVRISSGTCYVKGYEVNVQVPEYLITPKSTTYANVNSQIVSAFMGSYITANNIVGHLELDEGTKIELIDEPQYRITNANYDIAPTGNTIGTAVVMGIEYNSGTLGTDTGRTDIYLTDIRMIGSNSFTSVKSLFCNNVSSLSDFGADVVPDPTTNSTVLREPFNAPLLYFTGSNFTRKVKNKDDLSDTTYQYTTTIPVTIASGGTFTVAAPGSDSLPYTGPLSTSNKRELFLNLEQSANIALGGTVSNNLSNLVISGVNTYFTRLKVGENVQFSGLSNTYTISSITSDIRLVLAEPLETTVPLGSTMYRRYGKGNFIDLTSYGVNLSAERTVSASGTTLSFNLNETFPSSTAASISFRVARTSAKETKKTLNPNRYVKIDCTNNTTGPYLLGFSDVYKIKSILKKNSGYPSSNSDPTATVVTSQFLFDNGQRDTFYDVARITPTTSLSTSDRLLVELDYFSPDFSEGKGFYTVDSYPVNDLASSSITINTAEIPIYKSPSSGQTYDLRNHIDFRPVKTITATDTSDPASATINPGISNTFNFTASTLSLISPSSAINFDYSYYLARRDILHVSKNRIFSITQGQPGSIPVTPQISDNELGLAEFVIAPYPSISPYYAKIINRQDIASSSRKIAPIRQTMRDLGVMKNRIANLEYYAALSLLEKSAADMLIQDEYGMDRFKNGIFVDTFRDHSLGETSNPDYRIVVDPAEFSIRPLYSMQSIDYDYISGSNVKKTGDLITLDYNEVLYANISSVTSTITTELSSYRFVGNMTIIKENDIWIDTLTIPPNVVQLEGALTGNLPPDAQQVGGTTTTWNSWQRHVTGYKVYKGTGASKTLAGTYATYDEAYNAAQKLRTTTRGSSIETLYLDERTGSQIYTYQDTKEYSLGSKVVNTDIVPYIRPQVIKGSVTGLKPYAEFTLFFDGINMTAYTRPTTSAEFENSLNINEWTYAIGDKLTADSNGNLWFRLTLPNSNNLRFTVGSKKIRITDSITNSAEESSFAEKTFFAQGTIQTKQDTILSTNLVDNVVVPLYDSLAGSDFQSFPKLQVVSNPVPPKTPAPIGTACCFVSHAMITMIDGTKKAICDIKKGDRVLSRNGSATVTDIIIDILGNRELYGFAEHEPFATEDHLFLTHKGWTAYKPGDHHEHLVRDNVQNLNWDPMTNEEEVLHVSGFIPVDKIVAEKADYDTKVYALTLDDDSDNTYWAEDFLTHNKANIGSDRGAAGPVTCCLAYVMPIKVPGNEEGIFLTAVDIFCAEKHPTFGMWCEVRELDTGGGITRKSVPFSKVWFTNAEVPISTDGKTNALKVTFEMPIFLYADKSYAFVIHPEAGNPNYYFWMSRIGQTDINTGKQVTSRVNFGTMYTTNNDTIWVIQDDIDLTSNWYRASFTVGTGTFEIGNKPRERLYLSNISGNIEGYGEPFVTNETIQLNGSSAAVGDFIIGSNSSVNATVLSISSGKYTTSNIRFSMGETATIKYGANGVSKPGTPTISSVDRGVGFLEYYKDSPTENQMILTSSNGKFSAGKTIYDISDEGSATIDRIGNLRYSVIDFEPTVLGFAATSIGYELNAYANTGTPGSYFSFDPGENYTFDEEKAVFSRSNEIANLSSAYSNKIRTTMSTVSDYVSPVFDIARTQSIIVDNIINSDVTNENATNGGLLYNKYISKIVTLADYQDAEDINLFITAYRPPNTDVRVWIKLLNGQDSDTMTQKSWIEMEKSFGGDITYSSIANKNDFKEYKFLLPQSSLDATGIFTYTNTQGVTFKTFKSFQVKVGLIGSNSAVVPRVADLRTIALQI